MNSRNILLLLVVFLIPMMEFGWSKPQCGLRWRSRCRGMTVSTNLYFILSDNCSCRIFEMVNRRHVTSTSLLPYSMQIFIQFIFSRSSHTFTYLTQYSTYLFAPHLTLNPSLLTPKPMLSTSSL